MLEHTFGCAAFSTEYIRLDASTTRIAVTETATTRSAFFVRKIFSIVRRGVEYRASFSSRKNRRGSKQSVVDTNSLLNTENVFSTTARHKTGT